MKLHLVSFNVPFPADYGGVIDVFYKLKALKEAGVKVVLHCYDYGRGPHQELEKLADEVHYYKRKTGFLTWLSSLPYIMAGRDPAPLLKRLLQDEAPILVEGMHCARLLTEPALSERLLLMRSHNVEHEYYGMLASAEKNILLRYYFRTEAGRLKSAESILGKASWILPISTQDTSYYKTRFPRVEYLPAFHPWSAVDIPKGKGEYALYHGNLSISENEKAALFLIREVFTKGDVPLVIAGRNPSKEIQIAAAANSSVRLASFSTDIELLDLMSKAQVNVLPTFQPTGVKLKLLAALHRGRHCVVNEEMVQGSSLASLCHIEKDPASFMEKVRALMDVELSENEVLKRREVLEGEFSNVKNAEALLRIMKQTP